MARRKLVTYNVNFDTEAGVYIGDREGETTWEEAGWVGARQRRVLAIRSTDGSKAARDEVVGFIDGEAMGERNRSGRGTGRGYSTRRVLRDKDGSRDVRRFRRFVRCSTRPFRTRRKG